MTLELTPQTLITLGSVITAAALLLGHLARGVRWFDRQDRQTGDIEALRRRHSSDIKAIMEEQTLLTYGILACLKGLQEQGCNGPVSEAINRIDSYLNTKAHGR